MPTVWLSDECCDTFLLLNNSAFVFSASVNCVHVFSVSISGCSKSVSSALLLHPQCASLCALNNKLDLKIDHFFVKNL